MAESPTTQLVPDGFIVLRTTLLPFDVYRDWTALEDRDGNSDEGDRNAQRHELERLFADPVIHQALFLASPSLEASIDAWKRDPDGKKGRRTEASLVRYLARMTSRPTPFGLFAGCSVGTVGDQTRLHLAAPERHRTHTRLDMGYLSQLAASWNDDAAIRNVVSFRPNDGLYRAHGQLRFAETFTDDEGRRTYSLSQVEPSDYVLATLERAASGATVAELAQALGDQTGAPVEEASAFVHELIDAQLLVSDLGPVLTGADALQSMLDILHGLGTPAETRARLLESTCSAISALDAQGLGVDPHRYRVTAAKLDEMPVAAKLDRVFHVDLFPAVEQCTIGRPIVDTIEETIHLLHRIMPREERGDLVRFRDAFRARYQDREVPLLEVLDEDAGIGFDPAPEHQADPSPLLADLPLSTDGEGLVPWGERDATLLRLLCATMRRNEDVLRLDEEAIEALSVEEAPPLPNALAANISLAAPSGEALDRGAFTLHWHGAFGPSGALYLGRFCQGDPALLKHVAAHLAHEEQATPDAWFAEIVHLPQGRMGNILARPALRQHEIVYHGRSGSGESKRVVLDDLLVGVSGDTIFLRSRRYGKRVLPRLTSAHNASNAELGVYRFLTALQVQGVANWLAWDWGVLQGAPFLPRVEVDNVVLARARWRLDARDLAPLASEGASAVAALRARLSLPRWVVLVEGDRQLPLDLESGVCRATLAARAAGEEMLDLSELHPPPSESVVTGPSGRHQHEILVPFIARRATSEEPRLATDVAKVLAPSSGETPRRLFAPGDSWLYAKIYLATGLADRLLLDTIVPLIETCRADASIDRWFFLRFRDQDPHLRVRLHGEPYLLREHVWPELRLALEPHLAEGTVHRLQLDSYDREVERYGGAAAIELAEAWFEVDSDATLELLPYLQGDVGDRRWLLALRAVDRMFDDLRQPLDARCTSLRSMRDGLAREFRSPRTLRRELDARYRALRPLVDTWMLPSGVPSPERPEELDTLLDTRSLRLSPLAALWHRLEAESRLSEPLATIALSLVHMTVNRLLPSAARAHELVLYDFLERAYRSRQARQEHS